MFTVQLRRSCRLRTVRICTAMIPCIEIENMKNVSNDRDE